MAKVSAIGLLSYLIPQKVWKNLVRPLIAFSVGSLMGGAFFHLIPHALEDGKDPVHVFGLVLVGFSIMFLTEKTLHWHHCHDHAHEHSGTRSTFAKKPLGALNLISDGFHNFIDGVGVAIAFMADIKLGIAALVATAIHELPQELGDYTVLVHSGYSRKKALVLNLLASLTFGVGVLVTVGLSQAIPLHYLVPIAAGNFIYVSASDLIPEVKKHETFTAVLLHFLCYLAGLGLLYFTHVALPH
jgi:zinc and cadmium transporter